MEHKIINTDLNTELIVDETSGSNTCIIVYDFESEPSHHYLTPQDLSDFIGVLLHVQAKKRKGGKNV